MLDILQYLYEQHYLVDDHYPDTQALALRLSAAGFDQAEIDQVLEWFDGLSALDPDAEPAFTPHGIRVYNAHELTRLSPEGRGFLAYLENAGLLSPYAREWVIERALALSDAEVPAEKIKWIALIALWKLKGALLALWLKDLAREGQAAPDTLH